MDKTEESIEPVVEVNTDTEVTEVATDEVEAETEVVETETTEEVNTDSVETEEVIEVEDTTEVTEEVNEEISTDQETEIDWYLLDCALTIEVEDKALSAEERNNLPDSAFCGPNRSFPVNDCAHVTAARRLIGRAKLSDAQKAKILACVNKKAEMMKCDIEKSEDEKEISAIKQEISNLRKELEKELTDLKEILESKFDEVNSTKEIEQTDSSTEVEEVVVEEVKLETIENPSVATSDTGTPTETLNLDSLGAFEKKAVQQYAEILNKDGEASANAFWEFKSQYLNKGFDPKKFIN